MAPIFSTLLSCLLLSATPLTLAAPLEERADLITAQTIIGDIADINQGVESLRKDIQAYDGSLISETPLGADFTAIHLANRKGFADANLRSTDFNATESTRIVQFTIDSVGQSIPASVEEAKAKKPVFQKAGQDPVIVGTLKLLLNDHDTFSAALLKKISADRERAVAVIAKIHNSIQSGIDAFST